MADEKGSERTGTTGTKARLAQNPGANRLTEELETYIEARVEKMLTGVGSRMGEAAGRLGSAHLGPRALAHAVERGGKKLGDHMPSAGTLVRGAAAGTKDALADKVKAVTGKLHESDSDPDSDSDPGGGNSKSAMAGGPKGMTVIEDIDIGVPVREAYDQWTQFRDFSQFAKGVVDVEQQDDATTKWKVKVAKASRSWTGTITEQIPDERIAWTSEGKKGTTKGVVTFHPLADNLTKVLLVMEYFPKGIVEKTGALVRAQGRRARLDLKAFRGFVMMRGEATGGWRGEIRDGEVISEGEEPEDETDDETDDETEDESETEDEPEEAPRGRYEDDEDAYAYEDRYEDDEGEEGDEEEGSEGRYADDEDDAFEDEAQDEDEVEVEDEPEDETEDEAEDAEAEAEADEAEDTDTAPRSRRSRKG
ncbi:SRPBCC family protein [Streptomyces exfoliatus]|uniref:SRPBCC family protein n=1 Tax=Streptomyces exfoliatus TaxID=1905 RepID=A0ABV3D6X6_STREX